MEGDWLLVGLCRSELGVVDEVAPTRAQARIMKGWWGVCFFQVSLLGLLAKIKCSICSYQLNI